MTESHLYKPAVVTACSILLALEPRLPLEAAPPAALTAMVPPLPPCGGRVPIADAADARVANDDDVVSSARASLLETALLCAYDATLLVAVADTPGAELEI